MQKQCKRPYQRIQAAPNARQISMCLIECILDEFSKVMFNFEAFTTILLTRLPRDFEEFQSKAEEVVDLDE